MAIGLHDRISGHANRGRMLDRFLTYARSKPGVWFARKDEIAAWALEHRDIQSNFICSIGYGNPASVFPRNPRLSSEEAGQFELRRGFDNVDD